MSFTMTDLRQKLMTLGMPGVDQMSDEQLTAGSSQLVTAAGSSQPNQGRTEEAKRLYREKTGLEPTLSDKEIDARMDQGGGLLGTPSAPPDEGYNDQAASESQPGGTTLPADSGEGINWGQVMSGAAKALKPASEEVLKYALRQRQFAPAGRVSGRHVMEIPKNIYPGRGPGFSSLLARFLGNR